MTKNVNCLEGFRCPECRQTDELLINANVWASVTDDGTDFYADSVKGRADVEWDDSSAAECPYCGHSGTVLDFFDRNADVSDPV